MILQWCAGKPSNGQIYYQEAHHCGEKITICRVTVCDENIYALWRGKTFIKLFGPADGGKLAAMADAELIAYEMSNKDLL
jgi:hypothetical protein